MKQASPDLGNLIDAAAVEVARTQTRAPARPAARTAVSRWAFIGCAVALVFAVSRLWPLFGFHTENQSLRDLETIIGQARDSVEATRAAEGRLPDSLPNAALAGLVSYTPAGSQYQLFAASGGVSITLEPDGKKTIRKGSPP